MKFEIIRLEHTALHTIGMLRVDGAVLCATLEPPWLNNKPFISCVPCGGYTAKRVISPRYGETFMVQDVPGRSSILFHAGNWASNTEGCILLGQYPGKLRDERAVLNSGDTFKHFLGLTEPLETFNLYILSL